MTLWTRRLPRPGSRLWPCPRSSKPLAGRVQAAALARDEAIAAQDYEGAARYRDAETDFRRELEGGRRQWQAHQPTPVVTPPGRGPTLSQWTGIPPVRPHPAGAGEAPGAGGRPGPPGGGPAGGGGRRGPAVPPGPGRAEGSPTAPWGPSSSWGPPGVGKTELCKALAQTLFGTEGGPAPL